VQDERDADDQTQLAHQAEVQDRVPGQHGVRAADRHRQRVHSGGRDVAGRLVRVGAGPRRVHAVLAADLAELGLDPDAPVPAPAGQLGGGPDVLGIGQRGRVEHDRRQADPDRRPDQVRAGGVVQVHRDGHRGRARDGQAGPCDGVQRAVPGGAVLADLEHDRGAHRLGPGHDGLGVLDADDVERADPAARVPRGADDLAHGSQRHQRTPSAGVFAGVSTGTRSTVTAPSVPR
jgi:hypothetical protein